jgi:hypothetical protein
MSFLNGARQLIQVKNEASKGTAESASMLDLVVYDPMLEPDFQPTARNYGRTHAGTTQGLVEARPATASFSTELIGDGTNALDDALEACLKASGLSLSGSVLSPDTQTDDQSTLTIIKYEDGIKKICHGAMAERVTITGESGGRIGVQFDFRGVWNAPTDEALPTPSFSSEVPMRMASGTFSLHSYSPDVSRFSITINNTLATIPDITHVSGLGYMVVANREILVECDPHLVTVATHDFYGKFLASTEAALSIGLTDDTVDVTLAAPKVQYRQLSQSEREGLIGLDLTGQCNADSGDDEFTITTAASA